MDERIPCICPSLADAADVPRHPQGDVVTFRDTLDFLTATSIRKSLAFIQSDDSEARAIEVEMTFAKTSDIVGTGSESDAWMSDDAVNRYLRLITTSTTLIAGTAVPYKWTQTMPIRYYTRTEGEIGGNTTVVLTGHAFYDPDDFTGVYTSAVVCDMTNADLGATGS